MNAEQIQPLMEAVNNSWVIICFTLVVMMQPGFAYLEAGLIRSTNVINVLFKNTIDFCIGGICFYVVGYSIMWHSVGTSPSFMGVPKVGWLSEVNYPGGILPGVHFLFQLAFVGTAATICSGLVAGRIKMQSYFILVGVICTVIYPIAGHWVWAENGWLLRLGFHDFAGCSVVHCLGGFAGLAGAIVLGPRIGKAEKDELADYDEAEAANYRHTENNPHNLSLSTLGTFLLLLGWIGFNGGSIGPLVELKDGGFVFDHRISTILVYTTLSACAGGLMATLVSGLFNYISDKNGAGGFKRLQIDLEHTLNGILGGLVGITAGCDIKMDPVHAMAIGGAAGILVVAVVCGLNSKPFKKIDDPVGAFAVHGACGMLGIVAVGLLKNNLGIQLVGGILISALAFVSSYFLFWALKKRGWHRVAANDELHGLDFTHHGKSGYRIRRENLFNPARKIALGDGKLRAELLNWRQNAVRLSATGRFLGYESRFHDRLNEWHKYFIANTSLEPQARYIFEDGLYLINLDNEELFDEAYALICQAFEIATRVPSYSLTDEAVQAIKDSVGSEATYDEITAAINEAILTGARVLIQGGMGSSPKLPPPESPNV